MTQINPLAINYKRLLQILYPFLLLTHRTPKAVWVTAATDWTPHTYHKSPWHFAWRLAVNELQTSCWIIHTEGTLEVLPRLATLVVNHAMSPHHIRWTTTTHVFLLLPYPCGVKPLIAPRGQQFLMQYCAWSPVFLGNIFWTIFVCFTVNAKQGRAGTCRSSFCRWLHRTSSCFTRRLRMLLGRAVVSSVSICKVVAARYSLHGFSAQLH